MAENFGNESHTAESLHNLSVRHCDAGTFLAAVLECENPVIGLGCSRQFTVKNAKYPAFFMGLVIIDINTFIHSGILLTFCKQQEG